MMSEYFEVTTDYILKGIGSVATINKRTIYSLYLGFSLIFASLAGMWIFTANRFRTDESFLIILVGLGISLVFQILISLKNKQVLILS